MKGTSYFYNSRYELLIINVYKLVRMDLNLCIIIKTCLLPK